MALIFQATAGLVTPQDIRIFADPREAGSELCAAGAAEVTEKATALDCTTKLTLPDASVVRLVCASPDQMVSTMNELMTSLLLLEL